MKKTQLKISQAEGKLNYRFGRGPLYPDRALTILQGDQVVPVR